MQKLLTCALIVLFSAIIPLNVAAADCLPQITYTRFGSADINLADYFSDTAKTSAPVVKIISKTDADFNKLFSLYFGSTTTNKIYYSPVIIKRTYKTPAAAIPIVKSPDTTVTVPAASPGSSGTNNSSGIVTETSGEFNAMQLEMLSYINAARSTAGVSSLTLDQALCDGATLKSKDMAVNGYFSHTSPVYGTPFAMMKSLSITYRSAGENIAMNTSVKGAHDAFMNSSGHKANILNSSFKKVGLGFYQKGSYLYVTQWFTD
ncbi:MAG TPA: CAP domain-containing protein [Syntrophomonadaceae bacterium]|nr:CAP domain-containing protein [Syntrophomonadaceae bacterium]HPR94259.1 CAP domain-containing protein [Syntrophomonadaceae bacterium]